MTSAAPSRPRPLGARVLHAAAVLTTPLLPDDYLTLLNPLWSTRQPRGRVEQVVRETEDAATLVIRPGWGWPSHRAGQWVSVSTRIEGTWHTRSYSITSPAGDGAGDGGDGLLRITVKAVPEGRVSSHFVREIKPGAVLRLAPPEGEFVLPDPVPPRILFLTAGSGVTPVMGMLRTLSGEGATPDVVHVHSARHADDVIFGAELREMAHRLPAYRLLERHTARRGRFTLAELDARCPDWRDRTTLACGPAGLLADVEAHWRRAGLSDQLLIERFQPIAFTAPDTDGGTVSFAKTGRDAPAPGGTPLLAVGEQAGVVMPSGCRMGICLSCVAPLRSGQVRDLRTGEVHGEPGALIQTCVSAAAGACTIDL